MTKPNVGLSELPEKQGSGGFPRAGAEGILYRSRGLMSKGLPAPESMRGQISARPEGSGSMCALPA